MTVGDGKTVTLRLLFADDGTFHTEDVPVPAALLEPYERLIDGLMEDPEILRRLHLDLGRLVSARILEE